ncbi:hypothetical protein [Mucilaginibacter gotjawali]|uniref:Uncharacterized protein n=2 Tax=Mucilaginibacter gotjawali TaxID=1550579 RepID=A0A125T2L2_9SPHI|nr:hypothetical protein [Mucilaginibacter gotjawali]MBB3055437.1 hypothetical protein [Mucilaginibacter gotjawali]BAU53285.1 hypothetical protein MgSA37_01452 [Mucilaginibacter gotjawali]
MKIFTLVAVIASCLLACTKPQPLSPYLFGKWEVRKTYGGFIIPPDSTYKPGNGNVMQFNGDSTYSHFNQNVLVSKGVFHIRTGAFKNGTTVYDEIYFGSDSSARSLIILSGDILTLKPLIPDISTTDYQKIGD